MDASKSFKSFKVDEHEEEFYRKETRKRIIIISISTIILIAVITGIVVGILFPVKNTSKEDPPTYTASNINSVCNVTLYPDACSSSIAASLKTSSSNETNPNPGPERIFTLSLQVALDELIRLSSLPKKIISNSTATSDPLLRGALENCETLFKDAADYINESISSVQLGKGEKFVFPQAKINDIKTWLSSAITNQETCLDGLVEAANDTVLLQQVESAVRNSTEFSSNSLAIASNIINIMLHNFQGSIHRKLLKLENHSGFPNWVRSKDRRLLQEENPKPDIIVAQDGSGDLRTISEAVQFIPEKNKSRFVIYIKEGVYLENVKIDKDYWNVMIYGDGMNKTIVSGSLNKVDGTPTFSSGTFIAAGRGFMARDMGFKNTAGFIKEQAVAFRSSSDQSVFYRCYFDAFQDTLYAHSNRQFYRDCLVTGTVDFIFGNAAVVLQNCSIQPRQPGPGQFVTITAQGKTDPNQNTGISIQRCKITPFDNMTATTYLGRPWKDYSTTVFMQSNIGKLVDPTGWTQWIKGMDPPNTIFYAEYQNIGPGSRVRKRINWDGFRPNISNDEAKRFTVESFIQGSQWLPKANLMYESNLD
ncbi:Pectinesterase, catalytic [Corchorus olitorius]|uniref:Pectinesterase n=1 Tax=Corchorus olitorius TaxID=93759 RepID=A0A1R3IV09_9ROSI|nr:Pectinesterase, catalytic [Corchorus olitorius]